MLWQHTAVYGFCRSLRDCCPSVLIYTSISHFMSASYVPGTGDGKWMRRSPYSQGVPSLADVFRLIVQFSLEKSQDRKAVRWPSRCYVKCMLDLQRQDTRFAFGFRHFPEVWPWGSYITSPNLSFLSCRKIRASAQSCCVKERAGKSRPSVAENRNLLFYFPSFFHLPLHFSVSQFTISLYICLFVCFLVQRWITESTGLQKFPTLFCMCACMVFQGENT